MSAFQTHVLVILVRIDEDAAQGDELELVQEHFAEAVQTFGLDAVLLSQPKVAGDLG